MPAEYGLDGACQAGLAREGVAAVVDRSDGGKCCGQVGVVHQHHVGTIDLLACNEGVDLRCGGDIGGVGNGVVVVEHVGDGFGQIFYFAHGVDVGGVFAVDHIAQQLGSGIAEPGHANGVVNGCIRQGCAVAVLSVRNGQDGFVGVDDGLHSVAVVGFGAVDVGGGQGAVDHGHGGLVGSVDAAHAQGGVVECGGLGVGSEVSAVVISVVGDFGGRGVVVVNGCFDDGVEVCL